MAGHSFKFEIDISEWRKAAGFTPDSHGDVYVPNVFSSKKKIKIAPDQPINTSIFQEAIVLEENGVPTKEGIKEFQGGWVNESELKPLINFHNR